MVVITMISLTLPSFLPLNGYHVNIPSAVFKFCFLAPLPLSLQAIHCCLHGCVNGSHDEVTQIFVKAALDKDCVAQIMNKYVLLLLLLWTTFVVVDELLLFHSSAGRVSVELIDSETGDGNINSLIMFAMYPLATLAPKLPQVSVRVNLASISSSFS